MRQMDPGKRMAAPFEMRDGKGGQRDRWEIPTVHGLRIRGRTPYEVSDLVGPYVETISRGAFNKTLNDGADLNFRVNHCRVTMARTKSGNPRLDAIGPDGSHIWAQGRTDIGSRHEPPRTGLLRMTRGVVGPSAARPTKYIARTTRWLLGPRRCDDSLRHQHGHGRPTPACRLGALSGKAR